MKNSTIIALVGALIIIVGVGVFFLKKTIEYKKDTQSPVVVPTAPVVTENTSKETDVQVPEVPPVDKTKTVIGASVEKRDITAYHYGTGDTELLFVGGIHGGYGGNTVLVAYELMDYLEKNTNKIPENVRVTVIPVLNPDGLNVVVGTPGRFSPSAMPTKEKTIPGRFNANMVDLNRNFDCDWQSAGMWQNTKVSGGDKVFSEPESQAFKKYIEGNEPDAVVAWYSAAGGVYSSNCHNGISTETRTLTKMYATASGYPAHEEFNFYEITGDMVNWLAKKEIPAISVLLTNYKDTEWNKNLKGIEALFAHYAKQ